MCPATKAAVAQQCHSLGPGIPSETQTLANGEVKVGVATPCKSCRFFYMDFTFHKQACCIFMPMLPTVRHSWLVALIR